MHNDVAHCGCSGGSGGSCDYSRFDHCVANVHVVIGGDI